jgi:hypothetical protein
MPRVVPSQVVQVIDQLFPQAQKSRNTAVLAGPQLTAVVAFARQIPPELLTFTGQDLSDYVVALEFMENTEQRTQALQRGFQAPEYRETSVIVLLREALAKCPDEVPAPSTTELPFIADLALRDSIRRDISAANQDMANGEWKGATVLAGAATEALLLWAIQETKRLMPGKIEAATDTAKAAGTLGANLQSNPERWDFIELIEIALSAGYIKPETAVQARLCKNFRNLIHPGRAARLGQVCDRATALSALAAVEHVVRDLTP